MNTKYAGRLSAIVIAAALSAGGASAATLSNVSIVKNAGNSPDQLSATATKGLRSIVEVLSPSPSGFEAHYGMTGVAHINASITGAANYTVSWDATAASGEPYVLEVGSSFRGGLGVIDQNLGFATDINPAAAVSNLVCSYSGTGTLTGQPLVGFPSAASRGGTNDIFGTDVQVAWAAAAEIQAVGTGSPQHFEISCAFTASAASPPQFLGADAAAFRFGAAGIINSTVMDDYPGPSGALRTYRVDDGHRISVRVAAAPAITACSDGISNDADGLVDLDDPGCAWSGANLENPKCNDAIDNDLDGFVDMLDPTCSAPSDNDEGPILIACSNGIDDDADGLIDHPADSGCKSALDTSERADCGDGTDNDNDGLVDLADPQCGGYAENPRESAGCGLLGIEALVAIGAIALKRRVRRRGGKTTA